MGQVDMAHMAAACLILPHAWYLVGGWQSQIRNVTCWLVAISGVEVPVSIGVAIGVVTGRSVLVVPGIG
jgi:hypothetical protein